MAENESEKNYVILTRRVGNTNYKVRVYFNEAAEAICFKVETFKILW